MHPVPIPWKVLSSAVGAGILTPGWNLADEVEKPHADESRTFVVEIVFATPFDTTPVVQLGLTGFDMDQRDSGRVTLKPGLITPQGFTASITTWAATRLYAVEFHWLAIGA